MWSYDPNKLNDPLVGPLYQVRFKLGDVDEATPHIQDEEIEALLLLNGGSISRTTIVAAEHILMRYSQEATYSQGSYREELNNRATLFKQIVADLRKRHSGARPTILKRFTREQDRESGRL